MSNGNGAGKDPIVHEPSFFEDASIYYARKVRGLFLAAGLIMVLAVPILSDEIFVNRYADILLLISFFWILLFGVAGTLGRKRMTVDIAISACALIFFEYAAIINYERYAYTITPIFIVSQVLAVIFFLSLFFSILTYRRFCVENEES